MCRNEENIVYTVTKATVLDLSINKFKNFRSKLVDNARMLDEKIKLYQLDQVDGYQCFLTKIKMPMMFADRSIINVYYPKDNSANDFTVISSSLDTEQVEIAHKDKIGKDVKMTNYLNYVNLKEQFSDTGSACCQWTSITAHDLNGFAHETLKQKERERMVK